MNLEKYMFPCMSKSLFGLDCPGCGMQRSFVLLLKGDFTEAFQMFPAIFTTVVFFGFVGLHFIDKQRSYHKYMVFFGITNAAIMLLAYFIKIYNLLT